MCKVVFLYISSQIHHICLQLQVHFMRKMQVQCTHMYWEMESFPSVRKLCVPLEGGNEKSGNWGLSMETRPAEAEADYVLFLFTYYLLPWSPRRGGQTGQRGWFRQGAGALPTRAEQGVTAVERRRPTLRPAGALRNFPRPAGGQMH